MKLRHKDSKMLNFFFFSQLSLVQLTSGARYTHFILFAWPLFFYYNFFCLTLSEAPPINAFPANHAHILNSSENCFSLAPFCLLLITQFPKTLRIYQFSRYRVRGYFIPSFFHLGQLNYNGAKTMNKGGITERWGDWGGGYGGKELSKKT